MANYYEILGVALDASTDDIRRAFRRRAKERHPDTHSGAEAAMVLLNQAYETLRDPSRREAYNAELRPARPLPQRPIKPDLGVVDPLVFLSWVFQPLDDRMRGTLSALDAAIEELAYDLYDDAYLARFGETLEGAITHVNRSIRELDRSDWPAPWSSSLILYSQGLRQVEDALEDFETFLQNFDEDLIVQGRSIIAGASELLSEARASLRVG